MDFSPQLIWFLIGLALVLFELMAPGIILVFFGMGRISACYGDNVGAGCAPMIASILFLLAAAVLIFWLA